MTLAESLRASVERNKVEALSIINKAKAENRDLTADEKSAVEKRFSSMSDDSAIREAVTRSFAPVASDSKWDGQTPLKSNRSIVDALQLQTPKISLGAFMRAAVLG